MLKRDALYIDESPAYLTAVETLLHGSPEMMVAAVPDVDSTVYAFAQSASVNLRALALAHRIRGKDVESLAQAAAQAGVLATSLVTHQVALALAAWRDPEPSAVVALGTIAQATDAGSLSRAAADALMMIHTKDAVPFLVKLLTSRDPDLRDIAVRGLSLFVRGAPILSAENLRAMAYFTEGRNSE